MGARKDRGTWPGGWSPRDRTRRVGRQRQPQEPPQQPPPAPLAPVGPALLARPPTATVESSRTVSSCPFGQVHGADDSLIGRVRSKVSPQARHRYSYLGTKQSYRQMPVKMFGRKLIAAHWPAL